MMNLKIAVTVALAAGFLLLSVTDARPAKKEVGNSLNSKEAKTIKALLKKTAAEEDKMAKDLHDDESSHSAEDDLEDVAAQELEHSIEEDAVPLVPDLGGSDSTESAQDV